MMPLERQVCSLELAKRLKELGVPQESFFKWHSVKGDREKDCYVTHDDAGYGYEICAAFTVAELGLLLVYSPAWNPSDGGSTEADFRATRLIQNIESGAYTFEGEHEKG